MEPTLETAGAPSGRRPVVVGLDGSDPSRRALRWAVREAVLRRTPLRCVHAWLWPVYGLPLDPPVPGPEAAGLRAQAESVLEEARAEAARTAPDVVVDTVLEVGEAASVLLRHSEEAEMVVVGDRGLGGFGALLLGSVGIHLTQHATCPVAVVRGGGPATGTAEESGRAIVVGVDGSPGSDAALQFALEEADLRRAPLVAVHAWSYPAAVGFDLPWGFDQEGAERHAAELLDDAVAPWEVKYPHVDVERRLVPSSPSAALVEASATSQMLVVGSRGRGTLTGLLLGSVSHAAIHHARCPVMVVRHAP